MPLAPPLLPLSLSISQGWQLPALLVPGLLPPAAPKPNPRAAADGAQPPTRTLDCSRAMRPACTPTCCPTSLTSPGPDRPGNRACSSSGRTCWPCGACKRGCRRLGQGSQVPHRGWPLPRCGGPCGAAAAGLPGPCSRAWPQPAAARPLGAARASL
ncbi:hypothetical protein V8C86DRAFT_2775773 [Haematococcus lacustris]